MSGQPATTPAALRAALLAWYRAQRRDLPWRQSADPYAIWVAEVMLQQTQVVTVLPYYGRWMTAFPSLADLAAAPIDEVLRVWQGLGYYSRARNLHRAAQDLVAAGGRLPVTAAGWRRLPGVGPYTAGAIASIACGEAVPAVDGNVTRVLARLAALEGDPASPALRRAVHSLAADLVAGPEPGDLNQALMELGATVCSPLAPACSVCPVAKHCQARATGRQGELPAPRGRPRPVAEHRFAFAIQDPNDGAWLVARRPERGQLGGLWEFPMTAADPGEEPGALFAGRFGLGLDVLARHPPLRHVFTHRSLSATPIVARAKPGDRPGGGDYDAWRWLSPEALTGLPISTLMAKLVAAVFAAPEAADPGTAAGATLGTAAGDDRRGE